MIKIKPFKQTPGLCGPASLKMVLGYYGVSVSESEIAKAAGATKEKGVSAKGLMKAARRFGFNPYFKENSSLKDLEYFMRKKTPVIVDWFSEDDGHYSVVVDINRKNVVILDPSSGKRKVFPRETFYRIWFDFPGKFIKNQKDLILRSVLVLQKSRSKH
jgi:ABC-type bacteriocin/lantibiotic exporter with double-glycine peptidase domain